ncbi:YjcB family protein [Serratia sp. L9]|uniref:YjcB family protein n=1 Tax=Serratia sp. L9 TaxID=3423946 RepID=UPI003D665670
MSTIATGFIMMRWELLSAVMMFLASQLNVICRKASRNGMAFIFSSLGLFTTCWFVMGLMGISFSQEGVMHFWSVTKDTFVDVMSKTPTAFPLP